MNHQDMQEKLNRHLSYLEQDENNLSLLLEVSQMYHEMEDLEAAQNFLDKASTIDRLACLGQQGLIHLNQGRVEEAKSHFIEALSHYEVTPIRYNLAFIYLFSREFKAAEEILAPLLPQENQPEAKLLYARLFHLQNQLEEAIEWTLKVLETDPDNTDALGLLAILYFDINEEQLAYTTAKRTLELNPDNYDARVVDILTRIITQSTTIEEIQDLIDKVPEDSRLWFALGNTFLGLGQVNEAIEALRAALNINPQFYDCMILLAWCYLFLDQLDFAEEIYQEASALVPEIADAWGGIALVSALKEELDVAQQLIIKSKEMNPEGFLAEMAEVIYLAHKNPSQSQKKLIQTLQSANAPASEKLALILEQYNTALH